MKKIYVPDLGGFKDVEILEMFVSEGDSIEKETPLFSLESDKAVMDIPSSSAGKITSLVLKAGDRVSEGDLIAELDELQGESQEKDPDGKEEEEAPVRENAKEISTTPALPVEKGHTGRKEDSGQDGFVVNIQSPGAVYHATPSVRQYARELGADLSVIKGTGPKGRITREDVQNGIKQILKGAGGGAVSGIPPVPLEDFTAYGEVEKIPLSRIRQITGERMTASWLNAPQVTQFEKADISALESFRKENSLSLLPFAVKAVVMALKKYPSFNASIDTAGGQLVLKKYYNIGIAVNTDKGLMVPVLKSADLLSVSEINLKIRELSTSAREGKIRPEELQGAGFTISSLGGIGGTGFTPIVNAPQSAILGISRADVQPVWNGSEFLPGTILPFSVTYDHRIIDGAEGAEFAVYLKSLFEDIRRILL